MMKKKMLQFKEKVSSTFKIWAMMSVIPPTNHLKTTKRSIRSVMESLLGISNS